MKISKMVPCLWFDDQAEEAARFYVSVFRDSKVTAVTRYGDAGAKASGKPKGSVLTVSFQLDGQEFMALNGGPQFRFSEAISFMVQCDTQEEIDHLWGKLSAVPEAEQCGWLKDKYGLSWQIVPSELNAWVSGRDPVKAERAMAALVNMRKLDIAALRKAYEG